MTSVKKITALYLYSNVNGSNRTAETKAVLYCISCCSNRIAGNKEVICTVCSNSRKTGLKEVLYFHGVVTEKHRVQQYLHGILYSSIRTAGIAAILTLCSYSTAWSTAVHKVHGVVTE
jgi:hypothetical protein